MQTLREITSTRANALVDPVLHIWHGEVAAYLFLGGVVAGVMVLCGLWLLLRPNGGRSAHLGLLPWSAPILLSLGMLFLWLDLENRFNAFRFYLAFRPSSPMSWGAWILLAIYPASIAMAWITTPEAMKQRVTDWVRGRSSFLANRLACLDGVVAPRAKLVAMVNVVAGAGLGVYTGMLLGTMASRPLWNSAILGPLFLTSGLSTGAAYMLMYRLEDAERVLLARVDMGLILLELTLIAVWLVGLTSGGAASRAGAHALLGGPWTAAFWSVVVGFGLVAPLLGEWMERRGGHVPGRVAAGMVLVGGFALRWIIVYAGQHVGWRDLAAALF